MYVTPWPDVTGQYQAHGSRPSPVAPGPGVPQAFFFSFTTESGPGDITASCPSSKRTR